MKHLKMYEGFEETQTIKDIFQDIIVDKYDIEEGDHSTISGNIGI